MQEIRDNETKENTCCPLMGDFNARILRKDGILKEHIGEHFLRTNRNIEEIVNDVWDNRERF
eukprot:11612681-Karenia_brevis.AAC.1